MNRLSQTTLTTTLENVASPVFNVGAATFTRQASFGGQSLYAPLHYEPGYSYPLIVWLHGEGGTENHLRRLMPMVSVRNYVAVAPRGTARPGNSTDAKQGFTWLQSGEHIHAAEQRVFDAVAAAERRYNVHSRRIFLAGFGVGGTMAFRIAAQHPRTFAGVVSLGGCFPSGQAPLRQIQAMRSLPVLIGCGRKSVAYPSTTVCDDLRLLHTAGLSITVREYPCGDEIDLNMLQDVDRWIMEQIVPSSPVDSEINQSEADWA